MKLKLSAIVLVCFIIAIPLSIDPIKDDNKDELKSEEALVPEDEPKVYQETMDTSQKVIDLARKQFKERGYKSEEIKSVTNNRNSWTVKFDNNVEIIIEIDEGASEIIGE
ncbi:hypothetical protein LG329_08025 [Virgibacillus necropolis]|uniref:hypothetical protein n=1 Tax=Virgibacillus necropolis TaxID=163877 RepID=UPI00384D8E98